MSEIKQFISQICLGYSDDFELGYYEGSAVMDDGKIKTVHLIAPVDEVGIWQEGECPTQPRPTPKESNHDL